MASDQNEFAQSVWIDEQEKIVSFHYVEGYRKHTYNEQKTFLELLSILQQCGFRFQ